jgi:hypothetical protein
VASVGRVAAGARHGQEWAPFRRLRQMLAPELRHARDTSNPFASMILACRSLNLHLRFFNGAIAPATPFLPAETRRQLASLLDRSTPCSKAPCTANLVPRVSGRS